MDYIIYFVTQLTFFQFYTGDWLRCYGVGTPNGALWTITVIIQFYILVYFVRDCLNSNNIRKWIVIILALAILSVIISNSKGYLPIIAYKLIGCSVIPYAYIFVAGMFCYVFFDKIVPWLKHHVICVIAVYVAVRFIALTVIEHGGIKLGLNYDVFSAILLSLVTIGLAYRLEKIKIRPELSYGLFIWHMPVVNIGVELIKAYELDGNSIITITISTFLISLILAYISQALAGKIMNKLR